MFNSLRLDGSLISMIKIFEEMFGEVFWKQAVVVFTRLSLKSSATKCQIVLIDNKVVCNNFCPLVFHSTSSVGSLVGMIGLIHETFGETF